MVNQIIYSLSA